MQRRSSTLINVTPDIVAAAYASGDVIGTIRTVTNVSLDSGGTAELTSLIIIDKANQKSAIDLIFFDTAPASSFGVDNAAYALVDADALNIVGRISIAQADYVSSGSNNAEATYKALGLLMKCLAGSKNLYMAVVSRGAPTYASASDLLIRLAFKQD